MQADIGTTVRLSQNVQSPIVGTALPEKAARQAQNQQRSFDQQGLTVNFVECWLEGLLNLSGSLRLQSAHFPFDAGSLQLPPSPVLYLNSSDSLYNLYHGPELTGLRVLGVAGSGDFPLVFIDRGAAAVETVDTSLPAVFFSELKLAAACVLPYQQYWQMFGRIYDHLRPENFANSEEAALKMPVFDGSLYPAVRPVISRQAACYFDRIQTSQYQKYFLLQADTASDRSLAEKYYGSALRYRCLDSQIQEIRADRYPFLKSEDRYRSLQSKLETALWNIRLDMIDSSAIDFQKFDFAYISNISRHGQLNLAYKLMAAGIRSVGLTVIRSATDDREHAPRAFSQKDLSNLVRALEVEGITVMCVAEAYDPGYLFGDYGVFSRIDS